MSHVANGYGVMGHNANAMLFSCELHPSSGTVIIRGEGQSQPALQQQKAQEAAPCYDAWNSSNQSAGLLGANLRKTLDWFSSRKLKKSYLLRKFLDSFCMWRWLRKAGSEDSIHWTRRQNDWILATHFPHISWDNSVTWSQCQYYIQIDSQGVIRKTEYACDWQ